MRALPRACTAVLVVALVSLAARTASADYTFYGDDHVRNRPAHIGLSAIGGAQAHTRTGAVDGFARFGLDVIGTLVPGFALGFTRLGFTVNDAGSDGALFTVHATPTFEFSWFPSANVQMLLQLGSTIGLSAPAGRRPFAVSATVTTVIGIRIWLGNTFSFGILLGNDIGATDPGIPSYFGAPLAQGELSFFGGLELGWSL